MDGKRLKELRRRKGFTLDTLSERTGISKSYLSLIERDIQSNPSLDILHKLAKTFDVQVEELVKLGEEDTPATGLASPDLTVKATFKVEIELPVGQMNSMKLEKIQEFIELLKK
ncbi:helix-turn-helix domain-containing protein [Mesobacillus maritimus]|uniref:Helix-turn-helix transcriptional regulator n=1 Tax=Mesobacillus maritimus TaxID=1643336 RepID=A0ABS7K7L7_9BACI|nr:helix-turn-helix transcriptional regulator [Mesobacillus maritimus]MBY0098267.1 helix-turn-helix transcriptional regulator [Mesobacillus maritimus]